MGKWIYNRRGEKVRYEFGDNPRFSIKYRPGEETVARMRREVERDPSIARAVAQPYTKDGKVNKEFVKQHGINHPAYKLTQH